MVMGRCDGGRFLYPRTRRDASQHVKWVSRGGSCRVTSDRSLGAAIQQRRIQGGPGTSAKPVRHTPFLNTSQLISSSPCQATAAMSKSTHISTPRCPRASIQRFRIHLRRTKENRRINRSRIQAGEEILQFRAMMAVTTSLTSLTNRPTPGRVRETCLCRNTTRAFQRSSSQAPQTYFRRHAANAGVAMLPSNSMVILSTQSIVTVDSANISTVLHSNGP